MATIFKAIQDPAADVIERLAELAPDNPFCTVQYAKVRERANSTRTCALLIRDDELVMAGCLGFLSEGRVNSRLEVTSLPVLAEKAVFWQGLMYACRRMGVTVLSVHTFGSVEPEITETRSRTSLKNRSEYRLDLTVPDLWQVMNRRHHRLVKKARSAGLVLHRSSDAASRDKHLQLANMSLERRSTRGERIDYRISRAEVDAFVELGAGEIVQAVRDGEVFSSMLVARSRTGGYAQSSGTSDPGRAIGSSHFLFHETACLLKSEGAEVFNLGGADEQSVGLQEFKLGLGSVRIDLQSAEFYTGSRLKRFATRAAALLKSWPTLPIGT